MTTHRAKVSVTFEMANPKDLSAFGIECLFRDALGFDDRSAVSTLQSMFDRILAFSVDKSELSESAPGEA